MSDDLSKVFQETDEARAKPVKNNKIIQLAGGEWASDLKLTTNGGVKTNSAVNAVLLIQNDAELKDLISFDEFSDQIIKNKDAPKLNTQQGFWNDADDALLRIYLEEKYGLLFSKDVIADAVVAVAHKRTVDPVKERIEKVQWDHQQRAERYFIDYLGAEDNKYTKAITKIWLTGAIARVYQPGIKFEIIPILEGKQGIGKSTVVSNLFPSKFSDSLKGLGKNKDDYQQLQDNWIIEIAELSAMKQTDVESMKNFISATVDKYRNSYGKYSTPHPRKCVFIGTTNQSDYLKDATGERRFYPIKCGTMKAVKDPWNPSAKDIAQILAEAKNWYDLKEPLFLDKHTAEISKTYQENAKILDPIKTAVEDYLSMQVPKNWDELSTSLKRSYYEQVSNNDLSGWLEDKISPEKVPLSKTTNKEILSVVFNKTTDKYLSGRINADAKHIKILLDNMPGWRYSEHINTGGKRQRGYEKDSY